MLNKLRVM